MAFRAAFRPLEQSFGSGLASLFYGGLGTGGAASLAQGTPVPFAKGGVIASPIAFPLGGGTGVAGESGAEAIMPLARGPDGRLGVAASGSSGLNVTVNVTATDVESFRRSETQIAALLARAVGQGQRNL
jgi:phage-related minor tail protein